MSIWQSSVKNGEERSLGVLARRRVDKQCPDQGVQKPLEPAQEQAEVVSGGGENGVNAVPISALEIIATHSMVVLEMADHGLNSGTTAHAAADDL